MHDIQHLLEQHRQEMESMERIRRVAAQRRQQKLAELDRLLSEMRESLAGEDALDRHAA